MDIKAKQQEYDAKAFFESWHKTAEEVSDRLTISPSISPAAARYHYNLVENSIIEFLHERALPENLQVLDIGSGAGHWIKFFREVYHAQYCLGIEISEPCLHTLNTLFAQEPYARFMLADIAEPGFSLPQKFDVISAIGIIFHIVNDQKWHQAVQNLGNLVSEGGYIFIGGEFGSETKNIQFHKTDHFASWKDRMDAWLAFKNTPGETVLVSKRIRSLADWHICAEKAGLKIVEMIPANKRKDIKTPQNNLLVLARK